MGLIAIARHVERPLPDCLPILGPGLFSGRRDAMPVDPGEPPEQLSLWSLLSRVTLAFALDYEHGARLSLATALDALRVIGRDDVPVADLPRRSGVSKEALAMALKVLDDGELIERASVSRRRIVRLTDRGVEAQRRARRRLADTERAWGERFGESPVEALRDALAPLAGDLTRRGAPLFAGMEPAADCWRADVRVPETLPWFPMVLHRGGFPDGS